MYRSIHGSDRQITINVGGTHRFTTSIDTLASSSGYFNALFSDRWSSSYEYDNSDSTNNNNERKDHELFLDQDGDIFSILLSYMRYGGNIEDYIPRLSANNVNTTDNSSFIRILRVANFLGIETLINQVKVNTCFNMIEARLIIPELMNESEDMKLLGDIDNIYLLQLFESEIGTIENAIATGLIPNLYFGIDKIILDVGGCEFVTSHSALMKHSDYFRERLSWKQKETILLQNRRGKFFLDADPESFRILLQFMKNESIDFSRFIGDSNNDNFYLKTVLRLAEKLRMGLFLKYIKARVYANLMTGRPPNDTERLAELFDTRYSDWEAAFQSNALPRGLTRKTTL